MVILSDRLKFSPALWNAPSTNSAKCLHAGKNYLSATVLPQKRYAYSIFACTPAPTLDTKPYMSAPQHFLQNNKKEARDNVLRASV